MTAVDLSSLAAAIGVSKPAVLKRSKKECWSFEETVAIGGRRRLYSLASLPADVQAAVARHQSIQAANQLEASPAYKEGQQVARKHNITERITAKVQQRITETGAKNAVGITGSKKQRMEARLDVLARLDVFASSRRMGICNAMQDFCTAYGLGDIQVPVSVRNFVGPDLCPMTLRRWRKTLKQQGAAALAGEYGNREGTSIIDSNEVLRDFVIGLIVNRPHLSVSVVHQSTCMRFESAAPKYRTLARYLEKWKLENAELFLSVTDPDKWKNKYKIALGNLSEAIERINQRWEVDSTPADIMLDDGRYNILGCIDVATRKVKFLVSRTSTAEAVCMLLRQCIVDWGVPEEIKMDNGKDYASDRVQNTLKALDIRVNFSAPFSPWEKPHIERVFGSFSHGLLEMLPGFIGHNVAEAQTLRASKSFAQRMYKKNAVIEDKLTPAELQRFCTHWSDEFHYNHPHDGLDGQTPYEREAQLNTPLRRIGDIRALDLLLSAVPDNNGCRTIGKKGISVDRRTYIHAEFGAIPGQVVQCFYHEDIGKLVVYHNEAFLCIAECPEITGINRQEVALEASTIQKHVVKEGRAALRKLGGKAATKRITAEVIERQAEQNQTLTMLPAPNIIHLTPALEAASEAADALDANNPRHGLAPITMAELEDSMANATRELSEDELNTQRFKRAVDYLLIAEEDRNDIERRFLRSQMSTSTFQARWMMFQDFDRGVFDRFGLDESHMALIENGPLHHRYLQLKNGEN